MKKSVSIILSIILLAVSCSKDEHDEIIVTSDWMSQLITANHNKDITLTDITIPASHDAGIYVLNHCSLGNSCNTQTQMLDMAAQLEAGIRIFDIRPVLFNNEYYTQHVTACNGYGCQGDLIKNMLSQTREFLDVHSELVFLELSNFCNTDASDSSFINLINNTLGDRIYKEQEENSIPFIKRPLQQIIPPGQPGKAVIIYYGTLQDSPANRAKGMFTGSILPTEGGWSNVFIFDRLKEDQFNRFSNFSNDGSALFEFSWTLTQNDSLAISCAFYSSATSIHDLADIADSALIPSLTERINNGTIKKGKIPNIISVDFADKFVTDQCVRLSKLNLK